jgi:hypothetical protein
MKTQQQSTAKQSSYDDSNHNVECLWCGKVLKGETDMYNEAQKPELAINLNLEGSLKGVAGRTRISLSPRILFGGFVGILTRATGFLKALIARVTNLSWAAEFHFAFTFTSCFLCHERLWF